MKKADKPKEVCLIEKAKELAKELGAEGAMIILRHENGQKIGLHNLTHEQTRECLAIASYYNEKNEIEEENNTMFLKLKGYYC